MTPPTSGATEVPREDTDADDDARYQSLRHPPRSEPDPSSSFSEYLDETPREGPQMGSKRGVVGSQAQRDPKHGSDRPRGQSAAGAEPDDSELRAHQPAGLRRYRGTGQRFRAEPGPLARSGEPPAERSDASITQDVQDVLDQDGLFDAEDIEVHVEDGYVELRGHVTSERIRRRAGNLITSVAGVRGVANDLEVVDPE